MSRDTKRAFNSMWRHLKTNFQNFQPKIVICNYKEAIFESLRENFVDVKVFGSYFHFQKVSIGRNEYYFFFIMLRSLKMMNETNKIKIFFIKAHL